jgi:LPS export ABC transporter permease LptG/LPS export ABC transporter permease LptF
MLLPSRIHRYVLSELIPPTLLGLVLYLFVLLMNHFFLVAEKALSKRLGWDLTLQMFAVGIPRLLVLAIPMSVLLGVLIAVGRLSSDHEWVAMQSAGLGPSRFLRPVAAFGAVTALISMFVYGWMVPESNYAMRNLRGEVLFASNLAADLKPRVFYTGLPDIVLYVGEIAKDEEHPLRGVLLVDATDENAAELLLAREGDLYPAPDGSGNLIVDLYHGLSHRWQPDDPEDYKYFAFGSRRQTVPMAEYLKAFLEPPQKAVLDYSPPELVAEIVSAREQLERIQEEAARLGDGGVNRVYVAERKLRSARLELHRRVALPMACFFLALLALPLGVTRARSGKGAGFAVSIAVIIVYWIVFTFATNQAALGRLPVIVGVWSANALILVWALIALWRMRRPREGAGLVRSTAVALLRLVGRLRGWIRGRRGRARAGETVVDGRPLQLQDLETLGGTTNRFVGRLDMYVSWAYLRVLLFSLLSVYTVFSLVQIKGLMDDALKHDESPWLIVKYLQYFAPGALFIVLPVACLVGGVVTFSLLTRSGELTAVKSCGVSMRRVTVPVLAITAILCVVLFAVHDRIAPVTNQHAQAIRDQIEGRGPRSYGYGASATAAGRWIIDPDSRQLYYYRYFDGENQVFKEMTVFTVDREVPRIIDHRFARSARWNGEAWEVEDGWYRSFPEDAMGEMVYRREPGVEIVQMAAPETFTGQAVRISQIGDLAEQMNTSQLKAEIEAMEASGYNASRLRMDYHTKFAQPFAPMVMVLLGLPFAFKVGRRGSLYGVGVALLLVLAYWAVFAIFNALGLESLLHPLMAAWTPNILFGLTGTYLMLYIRT